MVLTVVSMMAVGMGRGSSMAVGMSVAWMDEGMSVAWMDEGM